MGSDHKINYQTIVTAVSRYSITGLRSLYFPHMFHLHLIFNSLYASLRPTDCYPGGFPPLTDHGKGRPSWATHHGPSHTKCYTQRTAESVASGTSPATARTCYQVLTSKCHLFISQCCACCTS